jgi:hypothetical protein
VVGKLFFATSISVRVLAKTSSSGMSVLDQLSLGSSFVVLSELGAKEWGAPSLVSQLSLRPLNGEHRLSCFAIRSPVACFAARSPSSRLYRASVFVLSLVLGSWKLGREDCCSVYAGTCFEARSPVSRFVAARSVDDGVCFECTFSSHAKRRFDGE